MTRRPGHGRRDSVRGRRKCFQILDGMVMRRLRVECLRFLAAAIAAALLLGGCAGTKSKPATPAGRPGSQPHIDPMAYQYFSIGTMAFSDGDYQSAVGAFERALRFDPESPQIRLSLARCYVRMRQVDRAIGVASAIQPQDNETLQFLADCYRTVHRYDQALEAYRLLVARDTTIAEAYWYLYRLPSIRGTPTKRSGAWHAPRGCGETAASTWNLASCVVAPGSSRRPRAPSRNPCAATARPPTAPPMPVWRKLTSRRDTLTMHAEPSGALSR